MWFSNSPARRKELHQNHQQQQQQQQQQTNKQHYILKSRYKFKGPASSMSCSDFYFVSKASFWSHIQLHATASQSSASPFMRNSFGCAQSRVDCRWKHTHTRDCVVVVRGGDCRRRKRLFLLCRQVAIGDLFQLLYMHRDLKTPQKWQFTEFILFLTLKLHLQHSSLFNPKLTPTTFIPF